MGWLYEWTSGGMLRRVVRPDGRPVEFRYDALGRRTAKRYLGKVTRWVWDGNTPLHEWLAAATDNDGREKASCPDGNSLTTWIFEEGTFVPAAKIRGDRQCSIVSDYMGTPVQMYDSEGNRIWDCTLDIYGKVTDFRGESLHDCPFRFQGQYEDAETGLYYNRFRYYDPYLGGYISQDPIRLNGLNPTLYGYVSNLNLFIDSFGLETYFTRLGNFGEKKVMEALNKSGNYTHIFQVQNAANQGIDIIAKTHDGHYDVFEVKTTRGSKAPSLYGEQLNPNQFITNRLLKASENTEAFHISNDKAQDILSNIGKKYLIEVKIGNGYKGRWYVKEMTQKDWITEAKKQGKKH